MSQTKEQIKDNIARNITTNGARKISGEVMRGVLNNMTDNLGSQNDISDLQSSVNNLSDNKVDKVDGKGLSTNDYTTADKNKLAGIAAGAQVNVLEGVKVDGTELSIADKKVDIDLSGKVDVAEHQSQEDQSFVFRQTGDGDLTIDAKNAELTSIKGRSIVWNQLFAAINAENYTAGGKVTISDGALVYTGTGISYYQQVNLANSKRFDVIAGHKYLFSFDVPVNTITSNTLEFFGFGTAINAIFGSVRLGNTTGHKSGIITVNSSATILCVGFSSSRSDPIAEGETASVKNIQLIDLTLMFGSGNEPSTVEEFEAIFSNNYYSYNPGKIISNDASSLITAGFNQWDEEWENGIWDLTTGNKFNDNNFFRSKNYIAVLPQTAYYFRRPSSYSIFGAILFYDANKMYLGQSSAISLTTASVTFTTPTNCYFMTFRAYGSTYNHDICINISDPTKNGTYEPYWKSSLPLNLDYLPIKSHNIWDEEWEIGAYNYNTGEKINSPTNIRCKNKIPVLPSTTYYVKNGGISGSKYYAWGLFYDASGTIIEKISGDLNYITINNRTITTPSNAHYLAFYIVTATTYNYDICINLSDPNFNGQYEPYALRGGLKGVGTVYDFGRVEDDGYIHKVTKVMGEVDLGTLSWSFGSNAFQTTIPDAKTTYVYLDEAICAKYPFVHKRSWNDLTDKTGGMASRSVRIKDSSYTSTDDFKTAMSGVLLYYKLATPITYELVTPIPAIYKVDKRGTEQATFPTHTDDTPSTPFCAEIGYSK